MNCEAIHIVGPNDKGIDLILVEGDRQYVVQVKRRSTDAAESVQGVREFVGAMVLQGYVNGLFVSTAPRFSRQAAHTVRLAAERKLVEQISLIDSSRLIDVCKLTANRMPPAWKQFASTKSDPPFDFGEDWYFAFSTRE
jgi:predicted helicase